MCYGPLTQRAHTVQCRACALGFPCDDGIYVLGPFFAQNGAGDTPESARMARLASEALELGWDEALRRFTHEVLSGKLKLPTRSRWARARAKLAGTTWEDTLQDLVDPTRVGWKFLLDLSPHASLLVLGPSWGTVPLSLARNAAHVVVLDGDADRLRLIQQQAADARLDNLTLARVMDPTRLPVADGTIDLAVVPGLGEWLTAIAGDRRLPPTAGRDLLMELRRVLVPGGQVYVATDNRKSVGALVGRRTAAGGFSPETLRGAAFDAGFVTCELFAPVPFRHKFHQVLDLDRTSRMNFCADAYRTRGRVVRPLVKAWDRLNGNGSLEQHLYEYMPGVGAVLSTEPGIRSFAERVLHHVGAPGASLSRYYVRPKGVAVLVGAADGDAPGMIVRLPLDERAEATCRLHHDAIRTLAADERIPTELRALFPQPIDDGSFEGQPYFAESGVPGEVGRVYYSRSTRRYDRAIVSAAEVLCALRRATETPVLMDAAALNALCLQWLDELCGLVAEERRAPLVAMARFLERTLAGTTLPLGWHHGDYDFANLLYGPDDAVTGVLDFEVFSARGLPLIDLMVLLARRPIRQRGFAFGTLFARAILGRTLPPLEKGILEREMQTLGVDEALYQALALCCWLNHLRLRRDTWLVRSPSWLDENLHEVLEIVRRTL